MQGARLAPPSPPPVRVCAHAVRRWSGGSCTGPWAFGLGPRSLGLACWVVCARAEAGPRSL
eukprot:2881311-Alexandrium_andersonii.AAC.1